MGLGTVGLYYRDPRQSGLGTVGLYYRDPIESGAGYCRVILQRSNIEWGRIL